MKYWKEPVEKAWFSFFADGKRVGTVEDSAKCQKEIRRLRGLAGIQVVEASSADMVKAGATTALPKRIINKMQSLYNQRRERDGDVRCAI
jgi:predicted acetyltransferase